MPSTRIISTSHVTNIKHHVHETSPGITVTSLCANVREVLPECTICLNECKVGDRISWSPEQQCFHAYHEECILRWFLTLGRNADAKRRHPSYDCNFKMHCPGKSWSPFRRIISLSLPRIFTEHQTRIKSVCRQDFITCPVPLPK